MIGCHFLLNCMTYCLLLLPLLLTLTSNGTFFYRWEVGVHSPAELSTSLADQRAGKDLLGGNSILSAKSKEFSPNQNNQQPSSNHWTPNHYRTIISNSRIHILENASLVIRDVGRLDQGFYLCQAANNFGSLSSLIKLTVNGEFSTTFSPAFRRLSSSTS